MNTDTAPAADPFAELRAAAALASATAPAGAAAPLPAPVTAATAAAAAPAAPVAAPQTDTAAVALETAGPRYVGGPLRSTRTELLFPIEYRGKTYTAIIKHRPTAKVVGEYFEQLAKLPEGETRFMPVFFHTDGDLVPDAVLDFLDDDDSQAVMQGFADFLPARLRRQTADRPDTSTPADGAASGEKSSA